MITPNEDIIPITYMGGSGGNFLCHFIISAKMNIKDIITLSKYGNAHVNSLKDLGNSGKGFIYPDIEKIQHILSQKPHSAATKPYFIAEHLLDIDLINTFFKKSIRITYDLDDTDEIATVFYGKWVVDESNANANYTDKKHVRTSNIIRQNYFRRKENMPNILFVSWKELFRGNIDELINKLSTFTDINPDNFSRDSLIHWRNKTQYGIDTFTNLTL